MAWINQIQSAMVTKPIHKSRLAMLMKPIHKSRFRNHTFLLSTPPIFSLLQWRHALIASPIWHINHTKRYRWERSIGLHFHRHHPPLARPSSPPDHPRCSLHVSFARRSRPSGAAFCSIIRIRLLRCSSRNLCLYVAACQLVLPQSLSWRRLNGCSYWYTSYTSPPASWFSLHLYLDDASTAPLIGTLPNNRSVFSFAFGKHQQCDLWEKGRFMLTMEDGAWTWLWEKA